MSTTTARDGGESALQTSRTPAGKLPRLRPEVKLSLAREQSFYGPGVHQLMSIIEKTESIRLACSQMGISYSKGWKLINRIEKAYGFKVLHRQPGGRDGGKSVVTDKGRELMEKYQAFSSESTVKIDELFEKYFGGDS